MNDLRIRLQEMAGDSAVLHVVTRRGHPSVAELRRALIPMGLRVVFFDEWISQEGFCQRFQVSDLYRRTFTARRAGEVLERLLTALEPRLWAAPARGVGRRRRDREPVRADYLT
jgi:hypothetical protein